MLKTGELLVREGYISSNDIDTVLSIQHKRRASATLRTGQLFGMILCDLNLITPLDNYYVLNRYNRLMSLDHALVKNTIMTEEDVAQAKKQADIKNIPFISFLLETGQVTGETIQELVFGLFHIPFRSISDYIFKKEDRPELTAVLGRKDSSTHRVIPLVLKENTILFGITDTDNILFIRRLNERYPQYRFKVMFIPFSGFSWFHNIIYSNHDGGKEHCPKIPVDLSLLLNFRTMIKNPELEPDAVKTLYSSYEQLRQLAGNPARPDYLDRFKEFIRINHEHLSKKYQTRNIEFSLEKNGNKVRLMALPQKKR